MSTVDFMWNCLHFVPAVWCVCVSYINLYIYIYLCDFMCIYIYMYTPWTTLNGGHWEHWSINAMWMGPRAPEATSNWVQVRLGLTSPPSPAATWCLVPPPEITDDPDDGGDHFSPQLSTATDWDLVANVTHAILTVRRALLSICLAGTLDDSCYVPCRKRVCCRTAAFISNLPPPSRTGRAKFACSISSNATTMMCVYMYINESSIYIYM